MRLQLLLGFCCAASVLSAAPITSGSIANTTNTGLSETILNLTTSSFSFFGRALSPPRASVCTAPGCISTFDFNGTLTLLAGQLTYGGTTYLHTGAGSFTVTLALSGPSVPYVLSNAGGGTYPIGPYPGVADSNFLLSSGSFTFSDGSVSISDTITGAGAVRAVYNAGSPNIDPFNPGNLIESRLTYTFADVPEPASVLLTGAGLILAGWRRRRSG